MSRTTTTSTMSSKKLSSSKKNQAVQARLAKFSALGFNIDPDIRKEIGEEAYAAKLIRQSSGITQDIVDFTQGPFSSESYSTEVTDELLRHIHNVKTKLGGSHWSSNEKDASTSVKKEDSGNMSVEDFVKEAVVMDSDDDGDDDDGDDGDDDNDEDYEQSDEDDKSVEKLTRKMEIIDFANTELTTKPTIDVKKKNSRPAAAKVEEIDAEHRANIANTFDIDIPLTWLEYPAIKCKRCRGVPVEFDDDYFIDWLAKLNTFQPKSIDDVHIFFGEFVTGFRRDLHHHFTRPNEDFVSTPSNTPVKKAER